MGCRYRYVARFLGRQFATVRELTEYEPNSRQSLTAESGPLRCGGSRLFAETAEGTRVTLVGAGASDGFFRLAEPVLLRAAGRQLRGDVARLKRLLEETSEHLGP